MKQLITSGLCAFLLLIGVGTTQLAYAENATSTATTTATTATTTATTTVATTTTSTGSTTVATTTATSTQSNIAGLLAQLAKLTALFNDLKAKLMGVQTEIKELKVGLRVGMTDADIKVIQEALASDPTIYPGGFKTGYFGPLTVEAIKKFQAKNGLEVTGEINPETKAALDTIFAQRRTEGHFPWGLLIAPGQHRAEFEERLRVSCGITSATSTVALPCVRVKEKYKFEMDDKGRMKMEMKVEQDDDEDVNEDDEDEDLDEDEDIDDDEDDDEEDDEDDN